MFAAFTRYSLSLTRPVLFLLAVILGISMAAGSNPQVGQVTSCRGVTPFAAVNRTLCLLSPSHLFNGQRKSLF